MNKGFFSVPPLAFGLLALCFILPSTQAADNCPAKTQDAVAPSGMCKTFTSECLIPSSWKKVESCRAVRTSTASRPEDVTERRYGDNYWAKRRTQKRSRTTRSSQRYKRFGRGAITQSTKLRNDEIPLESKAERRAKSALKDRHSYRKRNFSDQSLKKYNPKRNLYRQDGETTKKEKRKANRNQWGSRRPPLQSRSEVQRVGGISSTPHWRTAQSQHFKTKQYGTSPYWNKPSNLKKKIKKKTHTRRTISHYRGWRGARLEGSLDGSTE